MKFRYIFQKVQVYTPLCYSNHSILFIELIRENYCQIKATETVQCTVWDKPKKS